LLPALITFLHGDSNSPHILFPTMPATSMFVLPTLILGLCISSAEAGSYKLSQNNVGNTFLQNFQWETTANPSGGRV